MGKKLKIYTHHNHYHKLGDKKKNNFLLVLQKVGAAFFGVFYFFGVGIIKSILFFKRSAALACFHTGNAIFNFVIGLAKGVVREVKNTKASLPKRLKLISSLQFNRGMLLFIICIALGFSVISSLHLVAKGLQLKDKIIHTAFLGNTYLTQAKTALTSQNLDQAQNRFALAYTTFSRGQADIAKSGQVINALLNFIPQKLDADKLLSAAGLIAKAGQNFVSIGENFQGLKISGAGISSTDRPTAELFSDLSIQISQAQENVRQANEKIIDVDVNNLPSSNRVSFEQLKNQLANAQLALSNVSEIFNLLKSIILGDKSILVLFENNNELRAGGGFVGTFGMFKVKDGSISKINVSSVYDLDGQLKEIIKPPKPILNVSERWFLRDANWFADFPQTAKKISDFYEREGAETPDVVIALTPNLIIDWLKIVGPINMPKYGITLNSDNFIEQTQVASTLSTDLPTNSPKQILADLVPILLQKISTLDKTFLPQVIQSLQNNLNSKQIAIFSRDFQTQDQLQKFNWAGSLLPSDRDYLSIVSSNLGGTKTDLFIDQKTSLESTVNSDGSITNELTITRTNKLPKLAATDNLSYLRIYVPKGSKLISNIGFDYKNIDYPSGVNYKVDDDVYNWEKSSVIDNVTGTMIGAEGGKTFFGNWLYLDGGQTKTVKLTYQLPFKLKDIDRYSLLVQKQIGSVDQKLSWALNFPGYQVAWKNFDTDALNTSSLISGIIISRDYLLGLVLSRR